MSVGPDSSVVRAISAVTTAIIEATGLKGDAAQKAGQQINHELRSLAQAILTQSDERPGRLGP